MSMQGFRNNTIKGWTLLMSFILVFAVACKKTKIEETVYDNNVFQIDTVKLYSSNSEKNKQKSGLQYISILYADLFAKGISNQELAELSELNVAMGDKTMANELLLSHYLNNTAVKLPTMTEMRADVDKFVEETYLRFYLRIPTAYEKF